jgi:hypothetical protein
MCADTRRDRSKLIGRTIRSFGCIWLILCAVLVLIPRSARAGKAPVALYNKSISLSWIETRGQKFTDGRTNVRLVTVRRGIYISSKGQMFQRMSRTMTDLRGRPKAEGAKSTAPDGSAIKAIKNSYTNAYQFSGRTMSSVAQYESGARLVTVSFDEGFRRCSIEIVHGKEQGAPGLVMHGIKGDLTLLTSISISGESCSIEDGNMFSE